MQGSGPVVRGRRAAVLGAMALLLFAACSGSSPSSPSVGPSSSASHAPASSHPTSTATGTLVASVASTPEPSATELACPALPTDLATVRDLAKAGKAIGCFGKADITFRAYVPTTDGLGGVPSSKMTPAWIADPWTAAILQPMPLTEVNQDAWFVVRVTPALGKCRVTDESAAKCPFGPYMDAYVVVTGHFNDAAASTCRSAALPGYTDPGPSKAKMIAACKKEFVVTEIAAG